MDSKDFELYNEELMTKVNGLVGRLDTLVARLDTQIEQYTPPSEKVAIDGAVTVNTEKAVEVTNLEILKTALDTVRSEITAAINDIPKPEKSVTVDNISDAKASELAVTNLSEIEKYFTRIEKAIDAKDMSVVVQKQDIVFPTSPKEAIPVRLSDGKSFYKAVMAAVAGAAPALPFKNSEGRGVQVNLTPLNEIPVDTGFAKTAFGGQEAIPSNAYIEGSANYGLLPANFRSFTSSSGSTSITSRLFRVSTGTSAGGYGAVQSFRSMPHRVGKGITGRFSGYFTQGVADSWQGLGFISIGEEMSFGYNGVDFGVWHRYGGLPETRTITVTGASAGSTNLTLTLNSVAYTIPLTAGTTAHNAHEIASWLNNTSNQAVWQADQVSNTVIISAQSDGPKAGTYSYSHASSTGTIAQNNAGVTKTSTHIATSSWNGTVFSGFDPTKGNIYQIRYQNMGYGEIQYYIVNPETGLFDIAHRIEYPNPSTTVGIPNPSMRTGVYCVNLTNTTNVSTYAHSFSGFVDGVPTKTRNPRAYSTEATITGTNETAIISLRNRKTYNGYTNQVEIEPLRVGVANNTPDNATVRVRSTTSPGIEQNFQSAGTNLVADIDESRVAYSGGNLLAALPLAPNGSIQIDLTALDISVPPGLYIIVTVKRNKDTGSNDDFVGTITWYEDL